MSRFAGICDGIRDKIILKKVAVYDSAKFHTIFLVKFYG